jgi:hypothetical protein
MLMRLRQTLRLTINHSKVKRNEKNKTKDKQIEKNTREDRKAERQM